MTSWTLKDSENDSMLLYDVNLRLGFVCYINQQKFKEIKWELFTLIKNEILILVS